MRRIICIGNRLLECDSAGPAVHDLLEKQLSGSEIPPKLELIDGGLAGLDLLPIVESAEVVVFVDGTHGLARPGEVSVYTAPEVASMAGARYDHTAGLPFLLRCLPPSSAAPEIRIVGLERPTNEESIAEAAALSLLLARETPRPTSSRTEPMEGRP